MITYVIYIYYLFYKNINIKINNKYIKFVVVKCGDFCCISGNFVVKYYFTIYFILLFPIKNINYVSMI